MSITSWAWNKLYNNIRISDLEWVSGQFIRKEMVEINLFQRKYNGELKLEEDTYYVVVQSSFLGGEKIIGIQKKYYPEADATIGIKETLKNQVRTLYSKNVNNIKKKQRQRAYYCAAAIFFFLLAFCYSSYLTLMVLINGVNMRDMSSILISILIMLISTYLFAKVQ